MRIAVVHNLPPGGARRRMQNQMQHLEGDIVEICPETADPVDPGAIVVALSQRAPSRPRPLRPPYRYVDLIAVERAWRTVASHVRTIGADVVYANPCRYLQAPPVLLADLPPTVYFCDEPRRVEFEERTRATRNPATKPLYAVLYARQRRLDRLATLAAGRVATNSRFTSAELERYYGRTASVVPMGVAAKFLMRPAANTDGGFVLSVGTLLPSKGHDLVLKAAALSQAHRRVVIVAPRPADEERARLSQLANSLGVNVEIHVGITDEELAALYRTASAMLYLAHREPFGLASIEAQACGCPVIVADEGGLPESIVHEVTGWVVPREPASAAEKLDRLADGRLRASMSASAMSHGRRWTWESSAKHVQELLTDVQSLKAA